MNNGCYVWHGASGKWRQSCQVSSRQTKEPCQSDRIGFDLTSAHFYSYDTKIRKKQLSCFSTTPSRHHYKRKSGDHLQQFD
jgi:hypothetical protein